MGDRHDSVTLVIQHDVRPECRPDYERWLKQIAGEAQRFPGHLGVNIIRPHAAAGAYTIVLRFDSHAHLTRWIESETRKRLIGEATPMLETEEA